LLPDAWLLNYTTRFDEHRYLARSPDLNVVGL